MSGPSAPTRIEWSGHARAKALQLSASMIDVEDGLLASHARRTANTRSADWQVRVGPWMIAYDHPSGDDATTAKIVTLWRR